MTFGDPSLPPTRFPEPYLGHKAAPWLQDMCSNVQSLWAGQVVKGEVETARRGPNRGRGSQGYSRLGGAGPAYTHRHHGGRLLQQENSVRGPSSLAMLPF